MGIIELDNRYPMLMRPTKDGYLLGHWEFIKKKGDMICGYSIQRRFKESSYHNTKEQRLFNIVMNWVAKGGYSVKEFLAKAF